MQLFQVAFAFSTLLATTVLGNKLLSEEIKVEPESQKKPEIDPPVKAEPGTLDIVGDASSPVRDIPSSANAASTASVVEEKVEGIQTTQDLKAQETAQNNPVNAVGSMPTVTPMESAETETIIIPSSIYRPFFFVPLISVHDKKPLNQMNPVDSAKVSAIDPVDKAEVKSGEGVAEHPVNVAPASSTTTAESAGSTSPVLYYPVYVLPYYPGSFYPTMTPWFSGSNPLHSPLTTSTNFPRITRGLRYQNKGAAGRAYPYDTFYNRPFGDPYYSGFNTFDPLYNGGDAFQPNFQYVDPYSYAPPGTLPPYSLYGSYSPYTAPGLAPPYFTPYRPGY